MQCWLYYWCVVSNSAGSDTSQCALLTVGNPIYCTLQLPNHINSLPMHNTPSTTHHTAFHNPPLPTTNKHKASYLCKWWQNGTRCRDGGKVLWCHSHLLWLVFEGSIPTCTCFCSKNFCEFINIFFQVNRTKDHWLAEKPWSIQELIRLQKRQ